ncbi:MAG: hypothetical protein MHPSP_000295, partial [Paramarteilia canceri]
MDQNYVKELIKNNIFQNLMTIQINKQIQYLGKDFTALIYMLLMNLLINNETKEAVFFNTYKRSIKYNPKQLNEIDLRTFCSGICPSSLNFPNEILKLIENIVSPIKLKESEDSKSLDSEKILIVSIKNPETHKSILSFELKHILPQLLDFIVAHEPKNDQNSHQSDSSDKKLISKPILIQALIELVYAYPECQDIISSYASCKKSFCSHIISLSINDQSLADHCLTLLLILLMKANSKSVFNAFMTDIHSYFNKTLALSDQKSKSEGLALFCKFFHNAICQCNSIINCTYYELYQTNILHIWNWIIKKNIYSSLVLALKTMPLNKNYTVAFIKSLLKFLKTFTEAYSNYFSMNWAKKNLADTKNQHKNKTEPQPLSEMANNEQNSAIPMPSSQATDADITNLSQLEQIAENVFNQRQFEFHLDDTSERNAIIQVEESEYITDSPSEDVYE